MPLHDTPSDNSIPYGYCHCGCGERTSIVKYNDKSHGWVRGEPKRYILHHYRKVWEPIVFDDSPCVIGIPLSQGLVARISIEDIGLVSGFGWSAARSAAGIMYAVSEKNRERKLMHRLIAAAFLPIDTPNLQIDHIDGDGINNTRDNLRLATGSQNLGNTRISKHNRSGYKGVSWNIRRSKWRAYILGDGKQRSLGYYTDRIEAAKAYDNAARELHGEFAAVNFPKSGERSAITGEVMA